MCCPGPRPAAAGRGVRRQPARQSGVQALILGIPAVHSRHGPRRRKPVKVRADKAYYCAEHLRRLRSRNLITRIARPGIESGERFGRHRWKIERSISWLFGYRRLTVRYERKGSHFLQKTTGAHSGDTPANNLMALPQISTAGVQRSHSVPLFTSVPVEVRARRARNRRPRCQGPRGLASHRGADRGAGAAR